MLTEGELLRFWPRVDVKPTNEECWFWTGAHTSRGYGQFCREGGAKAYAHRLMWEAMHGEIPEGLCVCHTCDNEGCVNPLHLFLGTQGDNMRDKERKGRGGQVHGEQNGAAKLNRGQVLEIRALVEEGESLRVVGRRFGVSHVAVLNIGHRRTWAWLGEGGHCG